MIRIPRKNRDLAHYVLKRALRRSLSFCTWVGIWICGALAYNQNHQTYPPERLMLGWRLGLWIAAAVISGFFVFRMQQVLFDRPARGTIRHRGNSRSYSTSADPGATGSREYDFRLNVKLTLLLDSGKYRRLRFEQKDGFYQYYHEGNEVVHLYGLPYPINTDPKAPHGYVCAACGTWMEAWQDHCPACEHSMIDPKDL
jgi:hypothetical protein